MDPLQKYLGKKYKLKTSENFEEYLKFIQVGLISRKTAISVSPLATLLKNEDGSYTFIMSTTFRSIKLTFHIGQEFHEERADGVIVKSVVNVEGDDMIFTQIEQNGRKSVHIRKFTQNTLTTISTAEGWNGKCVRVYELLE